MVWEKVGYLYAVVVLLGHKQQRDSRFSPSIAGRLVRGHCVMQPESMDRLIHEST